MESKDFIRFALLCHNANKEEMVVLADILLSACQKLSDKEAKERGEQVKKE